MEDYQIFDPIAATQVAIYEENTRMIEQRLCRTRTTTNQRKIGVMRLKEHKQLDQSGE